MSVTIEEALDIIYKNVMPTKTEILPTDTAVGRIIAKDIKATITLPPFDNSAMDGYAVKCSDKGKKIEVVATIFAGDNEESTLHEGSAIKIMTGACIPNGTEAIVPIEDVNLHESHIELPENIKENAHIRRSGEDIAKDETVIEKGTKLLAYQLSILASQGITHVEVYKKPSVAVFATGEELKMPYETLEAHQLFNSNSQAILTRSSELGATTTFTGSAKDNLEDIKQHVKNSLGHDLIVTSGGVSVGDADFTKESFNSFGLEVLFEKIEIKPGKPTIFGKIGDSYILNLPGNPMAAALIFELFGEAIIAKLSGKCNIYRVPIEATLKERLTLRAGRNTLIPGFYDGKNFSINRKRSPGMVSPLSCSNGFILVDSRVSVLEKESSVKVLPLRFEFSSNLRKSLFTL